MTEDEMTCPHCGGPLQGSEISGMRVCARCEKGFFVTITRLDNKAFKVTRDGELIEMKEVALSPLLKRQLFKPRAEVAADEFREVADVRDVREGSFKWVRCGEEGILLVRMDGKFYATADTCTHAMGPLMLGRMEGAELICPEHGARFDVRTGAPINWPNISKLGTYEVRIEGGKVLVRRRD